MFEKYSFILYLQAIHISNLIEISMNERLNVITMDFNEYTTFTHSVNIECLLDWWCLPLRFLSN